MSTRTRSPFDLFKVSESGLWLRDNTIADVSIARHGLAPKLPNDSAKFLNGVGGWAVPPGSSTGAALFRERQVASASASLDFTTFLSASYDKYRIVGEGIVLSVNGAHLHLEVGTGGGPTYDTGNNYEWARGGYDTAAAAANDNGFSGLARVFNSAGNSSGFSGSFEFVATNLASTSLRKKFVGHVTFVSSSPRNIVGTTLIDWTTAGTAVSALRFIPSSGNITSGTITIYAMTNS